MRILVVDDSIDKLDDVIKTITKTGLAKKIDTTEDISSTLKFLSENDVDLLILDQKLPLRKGQDENLDLNGGRMLVNEIGRSQKKLKIPKYIIGLSQYDQSQSDFSAIWSLLKYDPSETKWSDALTQYLRHISIITIREEDKKSVKKEMHPTVFLEGLSDLYFIEEAIRIYRPELIENITLSSQKNAGANWVAQQLVVWGHLYHKDAKKNTICAVGVLDYDTAGNDALDGISRKLNSSNQQQICKKISLNPKYNPDLIEFYKHGITVPIEIESLFSLDILTLADDKGWLEYRNPLILRELKDWSPMTSTIAQFIESKGIPKSHSLYLKKVKLKHKEDFVDLIKSEHLKKSNVFENFSILIEDIIQKLHK